MCCEWVFHRKHLTRKELFILMKTLRIVNSISMLLMNETLRVIVWLGILCSFAMNCVKLLISRRILHASSVLQIIFRKGWMSLCKFLEKGESFIQGAQRRWIRMHTFIKLGMFSKSMKANTVWFFTITFGWLSLLCFRHCIHKRVEILCLRK